MAPFFPLRTGFFHFSFHVRNGGRVYGLFAEVKAGLLEAKLQPVIRELAVAENRIDLYPDPLQGF